MSVPVHSVFCGVFVRVLTRITVIRSSVDPRKGMLIAGRASFPCALGRSGIVAAGMKREGDGGTPRAVMKLRRIFYRADHIPRPRSLLPTQPITRFDAWCDDTLDRRYNRLIRRPEGEHEERLRRADHLYDIIVELGWNDKPVRRGRGSAIFWHLARTGLSPTAGCVAVTGDVFARILPRLTRHAILVVR
jgi:L,D-peptidoglycan transpeptidase YkuD (ErfK/YbiS/YcfS/YnhG family)